MVKLHRKTRNFTERYFRIGEPQAPKIEPANLKLWAMSCRNGRILTVKCHTTAGETRRSRYSSSARLLLSDVLIDRCRDALDSHRGRCFTSQPWCEGASMVYEWDARRARRANALKMSAALLAGVIVAGLPVWIVTLAIGF